MRKFLTTGLFSAILGIVIGGAPADAALVSRGFLDEALENYATTTSLDLKANQSDFTELSNKIGTLPEGITLENFYKGWVDSGGESMAKYIATQGGKGMVYIYNPVNDDFGPQRFPDVGYLDVLAKLIGGDGFTPAENSALAPFWYLTKQAMRVGEIPRDKTAAGMIDEINTKIGTLPSGNFPEFPESEKSFSILKQPLTYPTSLAELITALYGISGTGAEGLLAAIIASFPLDTDGDGSPEEFVGLIPNFRLATDANDLATENATKIGTVPDGKNLTGMISETDAKIGTLPTEYTTVGAALTAIKGIAEEAKAAALAAIPDPKTEGSTGKFVLTVDIVGDNATYRWEKIDREGETTTTE